MLKHLKEFVTPANKPPNLLKLFQLICVAFILLGIFFRFYNLANNTLWGWDQDHSVLLPAKEILQGDLRLIGPKTGVGDIYLGPLYSYISALALQLFNYDPIAAPFLAATIASLTIFLAYFLLKKYFSQNVALIFTAQWSVSPLVVGWDKVPWNVNFLSLATLFTLVGLNIIFKNKNYLSGWWYIGLGWFLGVNSHFSFIYLIVLTFIMVTWQKLWTRKIFIPLGMLGVALLPLVVFDFRNSHLLGSNILHFFQIVGAQSGSFVLRFILVLRLIFESIERLLFVSNTPAIYPFLGVLIVGFLILKNRSQAYWKIYGMLFLVYLLGFSVYRGEIPDYYFMGLIVASGIECALLIEKLLYSYPKTVWVLVFIFGFSLFNSWVRVNQTYPDGLAAKSAIVSQIKRQAQDNSVNITFDMDRGMEYGYDYLFDYYQVRKGGTSSQQFWISNPGRFPGKADFIFANLALGYPQTVKNILVTKSVSLYDGLFKLRIPRDWITLSCPAADFDQMILTPNLSASCASVSQLDAGMLLVNIPFACKQAGGDSKIEPRVFYANISQDLFADFSPRNKLVEAISFEKNRCIGFIDLEFTNKHSNNYLQIQSSLR